jgi:hypothetical protein
MASSRREDTPLAQPAVAESGYRSGQLFEGREAILRDLRVQRYLELPFSTFIESFFHLPNPDACSEMREALADDGLLNISDGEAHNWTSLTEPSGSNLNGHEDEVFDPFGHIIARIFHHIPGCRMSFVANPNKTPLSERRKSSRPDAYIQLGPASEQTHWFSIAASFEYKKDSSSYAVTDVGPAHSGLPKLHLPYSDILEQDEDYMEPAQCHARGSTPTLCVRIHCRGHDNETLAL